MAHSVDSVKERVWRGRLRRFRKSGLTVARFCRSVRVSDATFYHWQKRLAERGCEGTSHRPQPTRSFLPVRVTAALPPTQGTPPVEVHLPNGTRVCLPSGDVAALRVCIQAAGELSIAPVASLAVSWVTEAARC
jgi:hypothetical protein